MGAQERAKLSVQQTTSVDALAVAFQSLDKLGLFARKEGDESIEQQAARITDCVMAAARRYRDFINEGDMASFPPAEEHSES